MRFANAQRFEKKYFNFALGAGSRETLRCLANPIEGRQVIRRPRPSGRFERENTMATSRGARGRGLPQAPQD